MTLRRLAIWSVIALLAIGIAALLDRGQSPGDGKNATRPEQTAAGPQLSEKERLLRDIIDTQVESEDYVRARLDLGSEDYLKAYHDNIMDIARAHGGTITDKGTQQTAIQSSQLKATAMIGGPVYHTTPSYDDLKEIAKLMQRPDLDPVTDSDFSRHMGRLSAGSIRAFRESLEQTAKDTSQGNYGTIEPKNMSRALEVAEQAAIDAGEQEAKTQNTFDYLQPGETTKILNEVFRQTVLPPEAIH